MMQANWSGLTSASMVSVPLRGNINNDDFLRFRVAVHVPVSVPLRGNINNDQDVMDVINQRVNGFPSPYGEI